MRQTITSNATTTCADGCAVFSLCPSGGTTLKRYPSHTILGGTGVGFTFTDTLPAGGACLDWAVCGEGVAGSIGLRLELLDSVTPANNRIAFDGIVHFPAGDCGHANVQLDGRAERGGSAGPL